ncbi:YdgA family protein, partial [Escherichia coli]
ISLKPLNYEQKDEKVAFSGGEFQLNADRDGKAISLSGEAQSGRIDAVNEYNQKVQLTFNNLKTDGSSTLASFGERVGNQKLSLEKMTISVEGKELALLESMEINGKSDLVNDGKTINSQLDYSLNSLKVQNQDLGSGKLTLKVGQIDGEAWHQFSQQYNAQTQALLAQPEIANNPELYQEKVTEAFFSALPLMLKGDPVITIAPLSWKNSQGESALNLSLFLKDPATTKEAPQTLAQEVDRSVKSLDAKLTIPVDMATEFMTQVAKLEGYQEDQAKKLAKQQVEGASAMGQMFRLTTLQDNTITTSLQYTNGQITLNGQKMPLEDFVGMFAMLALNVPVVPAIPQQ